MEILSVDKKGQNVSQKISFNIIGEVDNSEEIAKYEKEQAKINADRFWSNSLVPMKYLDVKITDLMSLKNVVYGPENRPFTIDFVKQFIFDIAEGRNRFLWLCGKPGTGKTTLAAAIIKELCYQQKSCAYFKSHEIMQRLEDSKRFSSKENVKMVINDVISTNFIVFDEIGRWPITEWEKFRIFEFTNQIYEQYKSAIFISNMTKSELRDFMGKAAVDRFLGIGTTVDFQGESYRGRCNELYTK